jgi:hypothetical protein
LKPKPRWMLPLLLTSALLMMGASGDGCDTSSGGGGNADAGNSGGGNAGGGNGGGGTNEPASDEPELTSGQENALGAAEDYIDLSGFSRAGLIDQLSSSAGDGFSKADATFAADNVDVDYKEEAVEAAQDYLDISSFSESGLLEQLTSPAGDQFTQEEAQYAVDKVY